MSVSKITKIKMFRYVTFCVLVVLFNYCMLHNEIDKNIIMSLILANISAFLFVEIYYPISNIMHSKCA
jgi:hypothetical protein